MAAISDRDFPAVDNFGTTVALVDCDFSKGAEHIGSGNMAQAIISGLLASGYAADKIWAGDPQLEKLAQLRAQFALHTTQDNSRLVEQADIIILAVSC